MSRSGPASVLRLVAWLVPVLGLLALLGSAREVAAAPSSGLQFFYCYAVDPDRGTVFVSDVHDVGPIAERAAYGGQFARYLQAKGKASGAATPHCVMRATASEIERGRAELRARCNECGAVTSFEDVAWLRDRNKGAEALLAGKLIKPNLLEQPKGADGKSADREAVRGAGVYILGRRDQTDVVYTVNEENGEFLVRQKADLKGGKWTTVLSNNECPGWISVAYASNGSERWYYVSQGADSEGEASSAALDAAEAQAARGGEDWSTAVLVAFRNAFEKTAIGVAEVAESIEQEGVTQTVKAAIRRPMRSGCPTGDKWTYATVGVRG